MMRRMVKEDLLKFDGTPLFPERRAYTANYELSPLEAALYSEVTDYVRNEMNRADNLDGKRKGTVGFALTQLQRRLASSPEAIYQSIKRRRKRLENRLEEEKLVQRGHKVADDCRDAGGRATHGAVAETLAQYNVKDVPKNIDEAEDEMLAGEYENWVDDVVDQATAAQTIEELHAEIIILKDLEAKACNVVQSGNDKKWEELSALLQDTPEMFTPVGSRRKLIIFTEHRDTMSYLLDRITGLLGRPEAVVTIHGGTNRDERRKNQEEFRNNPDITVLLATDAAGEGVNLQNANLMVTLTCLGILTVWSNALDVSTGLDKLKSAIFGISSPTKPEKARFSKNYWRN
ncbi:MAG: C-terminal helicase domain-containing protein [Methylovulum sp.]|nr:C-terminal helicase domain-containing protein [Methylovulum sp.]